MKTNPDRLFDLLPVVHRQRDTAVGGPLRAVLRVVTEQVELLEEDLRQLYDNWFIETCEDWVVPYIGDLIGYRPVNDPAAADPGQPADPGLSRILVPRRDVANTIAARRRRGTLALLESLAGDAAGWPARAVEFFRLLSWTQHVSHPRPDRGRTVDLRHGAALGRLGGPFEEIAHGVTVRRLASATSRGVFHPRSTALFAWPLQVFPITRAPARLVEGGKRRGYTFSMLGHTAPLFTRPEPELEPTHIAQEINVPAPIRRRAFERRAKGPDGHLHATASPDYYGLNKSVTIWAPNWPKRGAPQPLPAEMVIPADLSRHHYKPKPDTVLVDPVLGRLEFYQRPANPAQLKEVFVSYYYGFSAAMGGGEYPRALTQPAGSRIFQVGKSGSGAPFLTIQAALEKWSEERLELVKKKLPLAAVIEILDSGDYTESPTIVLLARESLQLRAASGARPVIRLLDAKVSGPDALAVSGGDGSRFVLDGIVVTLNGLRISGASAEARKAAMAEAKQAEEAAQKNPTTALAEAAALQCASIPGDLCDVTIRHCTLVPGWDLKCDCEPCHSDMPSLELCGTSARVSIEHSILGRLNVVADAVTADPLALQVNDSIWDAMAEDEPALTGSDGRLAHAALTVARSTVLGQVRTHEIVLAEDSIFTGSVQVARRQRGCVRFCYVPPGGCTRTPRRYECQPDLVLQEVQRQVQLGNIPVAEAATASESEQLRVRPCLASSRYGRPIYARLAASCAVEIRQGAQDRSEMGAFHDLFEPQRAASLRARLEEFTPADAEAGLIFTPLENP